MREVILNHCFIINLCYVYLLNLIFFFPDNIYPHYIISLSDNTELNVQLIFIYFLIFLTIYVIIIM